MGQYFARDYTGAPFRIFSREHLLALGAVLLVNLAMVAALRPPGRERGRRGFRAGLAALLVAQEIAFHLWNWSTGQWTIQTMLPLHLCSALVWLSAAMLVTRSYRIYEFAYFLGIGGAAQALLTPDAGIYGFPHFRAFQVIVSHGAIVTAAVYMTAVEGCRPTWGSFPRVLVGANLYLLAVGLVNALLGSNYLFIARKPATASLLDVLGPWPWYILAVEGISVLTMLLLYLPFALHDRRAAN